MVVVGVDDRSVFLEDPDMLGARIVMDHDEFMQSWHDYEAEILTGPDSPRYYSVGVFIRGEAPAERPAFVTRDVLPTFVPPAPLP